MNALLPPLDPKLSSSALEGLPARLLKRAEKLAAEADTWEISTDSGLRVAVGQAIVTLIDAAHPPPHEPELHCTCLLSPRCAHIGAVCLAAPVAEVAVTEPQPAVNDGGVEAGASTSNDAAWAKELPPAKQIAEVIRHANEVVDDIVTYGLGQLSMVRHTQLLANVQKARVVGLPRLERALTALATNSQHLRVGKPVGRNDVTTNVLRVAFVSHLLEKNPADRDAIGQGRRAYTTLDGESGLGAGNFTPLYAEPIIAASGFAGVNIALATARGELYSVTKTPPGHTSDVAAVWHGAIRLGDLHCSHSQLARKTLLITGGTSSSDGRLGSGRGVRAALGKEVTLEMVQNIPTHDAIIFVKGTIKAIGFSKVIIEAPDSGTHTFGFSVAAKKTELPSLIESCQRYLSNGYEISCTCMVRDGIVLCLWPHDTFFDLPAEFSGRIFPGLDKVPFPPLPNTYEDTQSSLDIDRPVRRGIREIIEPWLQRVTFGGAQAILRRQKEAERDAWQLDQLAAPFAAELLRRFSERPDEKKNAMALAAYIQKI